MRSRASAEQTGRRLFTVCPHEGKCDTKRYKCTSIEKNKDSWETIWHMLPKNPFHKMRHCRLIQCEPSFEFAMKHSVEEAAIDIKFFFCWKCLFLFDALFEDIHACLLCRASLLSCRLALQDNMVLVDNTVVSRPIHPPETSFSPLEDRELSISYDYPKMKFAERKNVPKEPAAAITKPKFWWTTRETPDLSLVCACGFFIPGHKPHLLNGKWLCPKCMQERPSQETWNCWRCDREQVLVAREETMICCHCELRHDLKEIAIVVRYEGYKLDGMSNRYWCKKKSEEFQSWIEYWGKRFESCQLFRRTQQRMIEEQLPEINADLVELTDLSGISQYALCLYWHELLDEVCAWHLLQRGNEVKLHLEENEDDEWPDFERHSSQDVVIPQEDLEHLLVVRGLAELIKTPDSQPNCFVRSCCWLGLVFPLVLVELIASFYVLSPFELSHWLIVKKLGPLILRFQFAASV